MRGRRIGLPVVDNFEAMSWGPTLANGHQTVVLATDDNFMRRPTTQFVALEVIPRATSGRDHGEAAIASAGRRCGPWVPVRRGLQQAQKRLAKPPAFFALSGPSFRTDGR